MTCAHVLGLIDAGPFADYPAADLEAAWTHARGCPTCGPALTSSLQLAAALAGLPHPEPPPHLAAMVLSRIARLEAPEASPAAVRVPPVPAAALNRWQDRAAAAAGLAAACLIAGTIALGDGPVLDLTSPRIGGTIGLLGMQSTSTWSVTLAVSLVLYVIALFAPLRRVDRSQEYRDPSG